MARTWQPVPNLSASFSEGPAPAIEYSLKRDAAGLKYRIQLPGRPLFASLVEIVVGGRRHGLSFLLRVSELEGLKLERPALIETRYMHGGPENQFELSAGFPAEKPTGYELALGRALSPDFEEKCLACHGKTAAGIHCEACHEPVKVHPLQAVAKDTKVCANCHSGFSPLSDPIPEDLLISSQVTAVEHSECYRQSAGAVSCTQCHDPHRDSKDVIARSVAACGQCHATEAATKNKCLECHMPLQVRGAFHMVDHWIRVHPEQSTKSPHSISASSKYAPQHEYLRMMVVSERSKALELRARVLNGQSFFELARDNSLDRSKISGGYLGDLQLAKLSPAVRDVLIKLKPGEATPVIDNGGKYVIFQRLPRDFLWQANELVEDASRLKSQGKLADAAQTYLAALEVYPRFLRALIFLGGTMGEQGNTERAIATLEFAVGLYPRDPAAQYNVGIAYDAARRAADAQRAYRRAIELEPSLTAAYQNLGADLMAAGQVGEAAEVFRQGLRQNPLSASLYYNLSLACEQQKDSEGASRARQLAYLLDPALH